MGDDEPTRIEPFPERKGRDHLRQAADAGVTAIPFVGGAVQILLDDVIAPSLDKRREAWFGKLGEVVDALSQRSERLDPARLANDEEFVSAVMQASRIAMGTHREEKLNMLRDALINLATSSPGDLLTSRFLRFVEELSPEHFLVLAYAADPAAWYDQKGMPRGSHYMGSPSTLMEHAGLPVSGQVLQLVLSDLDRVGLARIASLSTTMTEQGMWQTFATDLGHQLIDFVRSSV
jgi:hypothetical protein